MVFVTITQGALKGGEATTESGFKYYEFLGIPYAKPPVNELRFKNPLPADPWEGTRDATTTNSAAICCQVELLTGTVAGSEDCLYLNVYTPKLSDSEPELKPVMVYIHGGGFVYGNGVLKDEGGIDYLIENDVVIVAINYRLGPLGFLCLDIPEAAGNMGLKDQVRALQWVQNNINTFGGNKNNVTIFGISAGSASCEYLMLSPLAKGLFHKCILQSGSALNNWAINYANTSKTMAVKVAQELGYTGPDHDTNAIYKVLLEASASELTRLSLQVAGKVVPNRLFFGFVPVIEKNNENADAFLIDHPYTILKEGNYNQVPVIRGYCNEEGIIINLFKPNAIKDLIANKNYVDFWAFTFEDSDIKQYNEKLAVAYAKDAKLNDESQDFAFNFFGDLSFAAGIHIAGELQCDKIPIYMYQFCYRGNLNMISALFGVTNEGAAHGDDMGYLLRHSAIASRVPDEVDMLVRSRITKMWTNFAKTSNPTPDNSLEFQWPAFTNKSKEYLNIDKECTVKADYEPEKMAIFETIYNKYKK